MGQNTFQKIHKIIERSETLTNEEKREFSEVFAQTKEEALKPVLKLMQKDSAWVETLYSNYKMKKEAVVTGNMDAWHDAIQKEKAELEAS
jgi:exoribonuclease R